MRALQAGYRGLFIKAQELFDEMYQSLADRSTRRLLDRLSRMELLLIDEMGYLNLRPEQSNIFFKLMEERYSRRDRLRHRCATLEITGPSWLFRVSSGS